VEGCGADSHLAAGVPTAMNQTLPTVEQIREVVTRHLKPYGVTRLAIFGSFAREDAQAGSDLDILITFTEPAVREFGMIEWAHLHNSIADELGIQVDLVTRNVIRPNKLKVFEEDLIMLYEAA
jgi:uncharacterized protein